MPNYKIICFSLTDSHKYGNILEKLLKLRYKGFILEEKYDIPSYNDLEFDQYDNPFARYIVLMDDKEEVIACSRINRTDIPYMAKDYWSHLIPTEALPNSSDCYEWTRHYVDSALSVIERVKVVRIIASATYFALVQLNAVGACYVTHSTLFHTTKKLGMGIKSIARIDLPKFPNLHFAYVDINKVDARIVAGNLLKTTSFDIIQYFKTTPIL